MSEPALDMEMPVVTLEQLLAPLTVAEFRKEYWNKKPLLKLIDPAVFEAILGGFEDGELSSILMHCRTEENVLYSPQELTSIEQDYQTEGKTINMPFCFTSGARMLYKDIAANHSTLGNDIEIGCYASRTGGDIADWHYDNNHNITLQLSGTKDWTLSRGCPHTVNSRGLQDRVLGNVHDQNVPLPSYATPNQRAQCLSLIPRSLLYVPPGTWHRVVPRSGDAQTGDIVSIDIRIAHLEEAKWISECVYASLMSKCDHNNDTASNAMIPRKELKGDHSRQQRKQMTDEVVQAAHDTLYHWRPLRVLEPEDAYSDGLARGASLQYLSSRLGDDVKGEDWMYEWTRNPMVALTMREQADMLCIDLRSVSSLTNTEYMRFTIYVQKILGGRDPSLFLQDCFSGFTDLQEDNVKNKKQLYSVLLHANVIFPKELRKPAVKKLKRKQMDA